MPIHLRTAQLADAQTVALIHRTARAAAMPWLPVLHSAEQDVRFFHNRVLPTQTVTLAIIEGQCAGFSAFHEGWLDHLYVAPDFWRQGVGGVVVRVVQDAHPQISLWTFQANHAARAFYAAHGFTEVERTDGAMNEEKIPDVRLVWHASP